MPTDQEHVEAHLAQAWAIVNAETTRLAQQRGKRTPADIRLLRQLTLWAQALDEWERERTRTPRPRGNGAPPGPSRLARQLLGDMAGPELPDEHELDDDD